MTNLPPPMDSWGAMNGGGAKRGPDIGGVSETIGESGLLLELHH
jgi:hypothetical protein